MIRRAVKWTADGGVKYIRFVILLESPAQLFWNVLKGQVFQQSGHVVATDEVNLCNSSVATS